MDDKTVITFRLICNSNLTANFVSGEYRYTKLLVISASRFYTCALI